MGDHPSSEYLDDEYEPEQTWWSAGEGDEAEDELPAETLGAGSAASWQAWKGPAPSGTGEVVEPFTAAPAGWNDAIMDQAPSVTAYHTTMADPNEAYSDECGIRAEGSARYIDASYEPFDDINDDPRYQTTLIKMQYGKWPEVVEDLRWLKTIYANESVLDSLLNEANLESEIVMTWGASIKGRRTTVRQERILRRSVPFVLLITLAFVGLSFYQAFVAPSRQVVAMSRQNKQIIQDAQQLTQNGQYEDALVQFQTVLETEPNNSSAIQGMQETRDVMGLVAEFDLAMELAAEGKIDRALAFLEGIQAKKPGFRNVDVEIKQLEALEQVQTLYLSAEAAYAMQQWLTAVPMYEQIVELDRDYESAAVSQHLMNSYYQAGLQLTTQLPSPELGPLQAQEYLQKGRTIDPQQADMHIKRLKIYFDGLDALDDGNLDEAINLWQGLYDANREYLGGYLAGRLYAAYLSLGAKAEQQMDFSHAQNLYQQAMGLQVEDISGAQTRLAALQAKIMPTPAPTVPPAAPVYAPPPAQSVPPTATPEPDPSGWIAFRTNRNGPEEIYLMQPDGTQQKPAPVGLAMRFEELLQAETFSSDGNRELRVMAVDGRTDASIYMIDSSMPEGQPGHQIMVTNYHGDEYDPVWSPSGNRIAFVANHTGNDEIWSANPDGSDAWQLTWNEWEWDKRPSFSPDGSQMVFYSNRSGWRQLWVMDSNGGQQYNISYNAYDDWDPVWIK